MVFLLYCSSFLLFYDYYNLQYYFKDIIDFCDGFGFRALSRFLSCEALSDNFVNISGLRA